MSYLSDVLSSIWGAQNFQHYCESNTPYFRYMNVTESDESLTRLDPIVSCDNVELVEYGSITPSDMSTSTSDIPKAYTCAQFPLVDNLYGDLRILAGGDPSMGRWVVTTVDIPPGSLLGYMTGTFSDVESNSGYGVGFHTLPGVYMDCDYQGNLFSRMNSNRLQPFPEHPNVAVIEIVRHDPDAPSTSTAPPPLVRLAVFAILFIRSGSKLLWDYSDSYSE